LRELTIENDQLMVKPSGHFKTAFLDSYSDQALLEELRKVAAIHPGGPLTKPAFNRLSGRVTGQTLARRFGDWRKALEMAGLGHLYGGTIMTPKWARAQAPKNISDQDVFLEMKRVHALVGGTSLTAKEFDRHSKLTSSTMIRHRLGSWPKALQKAELPLSVMGHRYTDEDCLENLVNVWTHYGRQPEYREMKLPPSVVGPKAYIVRWGTWRKALKAFVEWANADDPIEPEPNPQPRPGKPKRPSLRPEDRHDIPPRLRWKVGVRDRFRCVACGRSPATDLGCHLEPDHIKPWADGGKTVLENLQMLCKTCNIGKGKSYAKVGCSDLTGEGASH
jgi:hypothetical protein